MNLNGSPLVIEGSPWTHVGITSGQGEHTNGRLLGISGNTITTLRISGKYRLSKDGSYTYQYDGGTNQWADYVDPYGHFAFNKSRNIFSVFDEGEFNVKDLKVKDARGVNVPYAATGMAFIRNKYR